MKKMTKKEMYATIIEIMTSGKCEIEPSMVIEFCEKEIAALEKKNAKNKAKAAATDALSDAVKAALTEDFRSIADIAADVEHADATVSKITYRLNKLAEAGLAEKGEMSIKGGEGTKARKLVAYRAVDAE